MPLGGVCVAVDVVQPSMRCALHLPPAEEHQCPTASDHQADCAAYPSGSWSAAEWARSVVTELWRSLQVRLMTTWPFTAISSLLRPLVSSKCWSEGEGHNSWAAVVQAGGQAELTASILQSFQFLGPETHTAKEPCTAVTPVALAGIPNADDHCILCCQVPSGRTASPVHEAGKHMHAHTPYNTCTHTPYTTCMRAHKESPSHVMSCSTPKGPN